MNKGFGGTTTDSFPLGLSKVPFKWKYYFLTFDMEFLGCFVGVAQEQETLAVRPEIGWAVLETNQLNIKALLRNWLGDYRWHRAKQIAKLIKLIFLQH